MPWIRKTSSTDTIIENANPTIGLREDSLDLPSDSTVCSRLVHSISRRAAYNFLAAAVETETSQARARVRKAVAVKILAPGPASLLNWGRASHLIEQSLDRN